MTAEELIRTMHAALAEERQGIRRLDADAVARATAAKEAVLTELQHAKPEERAELHAALAEVKGELRRNLVLLAHARDFLKEAVELCSQPGGRARLQAKL